MKILKIDMRCCPLLLGLLFYHILNCEDKQSKKKTASEVKEVVTIDDVKKETNTSDSKIKKHIVLDDKSAMEFFLVYDTKHKENKVRIATDFGDIDILLFNETKFHRSNFIYLTKQKYFNGTQFFRVINNFMIQGGNGDDMATATKRRKNWKILTT